MLVTWTVSDVKWCSTLRRCSTLPLLLLCRVICRHAANASGLSWNAGDMDFTGGQMVLTLKLISMAVCFQDAHSKANEVGSASL